MIKSVVKHLLTTLLAIRPVYEHIFQNVIVTWIIIPLRSCANTTGSVVATTLYIIGRRLSFGKYSWLTKRVLTTPQKDITAFSNMHGRFHYKSLIWHGKTVSGQRKISFILNIQLCCPSLIKKDGYLLAKSSQEVRQLELRYPSSLVVFYLYEKIFRRDNIKWRLGWHTSFTTDLYAR